MKFKQSPEKEVCCFWEAFWVAELEGQERFNYTKYLRHPIHLFALLCLLVCLLACFIFGVSVLSSSSSLGSEQIHEPKHNHHGRNIHTCMSKKNEPPKNAPTNSLLSIQLAPKHLWRLALEGFSLF